MTKEDIILSNVNKKIGLKENRTLKETLLSLTNDCLKRIIYSMKRESIKERNKRILVDIIIQNLPMIVRRFVRSVDKEQYEIYKVIRDNGGVLYDYKVTHEKLKAFTQLGIIYLAVINEKKALFIPKEIIDAIEEIPPKEREETSEHNTVLIEQLHGMMYYYGYMSVDDIFQVIFERNLTEYTGSLTFIDTIYLAADYYGRIQQCGMGFRNRELIKYRELLERRDEKKIDRYKKYSKDQLLKAGKESHMEWNQEMDKLKQLISSEESRNEADVMKDIETSWYKLNNGESIECVSMFLIEKYFSRRDDDMKRKVIEEVMNMFLSMPNWSLKGFSFKELIRLESMIC